MVQPYDQDLDDVIHDPSFQSSFDVIRTSQSMVGGRAVPVKTTTAGVLGVVFPDKSRTLQRMGMPGQKQIDSITVVTAFELTAGSRVAGGNTTIEPDVITWNDAHYVVVAVRDYMQYGRGFVEVTADMLEFLHP